MARILVGVSGGIAAYKAVELVRLATGAGHAVRVVQTPASLNFVGRATFEGITGAPVLVDEFERDPARGAYPGEPAPDGEEPSRRRGAQPDRRSGEHRSIPGPASTAASHFPISHLELVRRCDVLCVAPASANTLAKLAHGLADNLLTSAALALTGPLVLAPAMNDRMWEHPATRGNIETLARRGALIVPPGTGRLASQGEFGVGRLAEPPEILAAIEEALWAAGEEHSRRRGASPDRRSGEHRSIRGPASGALRYSPRSLDGLRVLVSAGGTREPIDSVRYVGNRSSGRMGVALAEEAARRGAEVTLIAANISLELPEGVRTLEVATAAELEAVARREFPTADVLLMAAAVADFRPRDPEAAKISKQDRDGLALELEPTEDVLAALSAERRPGQTLVGFAAEHGEGGLERARGKLVRKALDAVVLNDISQPGIGFDADENEATIVTATGERLVPRGPKHEIATAVLDVVEGLRSGASAPIARSTAGAPARRAPQLPNVGEER